MPPDDTDGLDDADLPGLDDDHLDDADLPGLDDDSPAPEADVPPEAAEIPDADLLDQIDKTIDRPKVDASGDFVRAVMGVPHIGDYDEEPERSDEDPDDVDSGWVLDDDPDSVTRELAPYGPDYDHPRKLSRWVFVGGGFGILGLVLAVGFFVSGGNSDDPAALPSKTPVGDTTPPSTAVAVEDTETAAVAVDVADVPEAPFPTSWTYTATKSATIVPAPDFITATPIGAVLPWSMAVNESCTGEACTYTSVIRPLIPESVLGEVPESTWVVDGAEWFLDVTWFSTQSFYGDGTVCAIRNRDVFELTVTKEVIGGRSVPTAFVGTWVQAVALDLEASTGNVAFYCGEFWEVVDEWSLVGVAAG